MGLDMYLEAEKYIQNWNHNPPEEQYHTVITNKLGQELKLPCEPHDIVCQIGYWRKANAIHRWFVDNVQGGRDECQRSYVGRDQLQELLDITNRVLSNTKSIASKLLPTQEGFFFGNTDYNQRYWEDLKSTKEILERALALDESWSIYYRASW